MTLAGLALTHAVKACTRDLGFDDVAVGPAAPPDHGPAFAEWLDAGYAGSMTYLARTRAERLDPGCLLPGARAVVAVAMSYRPDGEDPMPEQGSDRGPGPEGDDPTPPAARRGARGAEGTSPAGPPGGSPGTTVGASPLIARYARGRDYHDVMKPRLQQLVEFIGRAAGSGVVSRAAVDTSAVLERDLAARAGLGWFGKNTNLLSETLGSYFFIGIVLTTADLAPDAPVPDRCGTCRACLEACPTGAFVTPWVLDARRCISYLTIEHRGPIDEALRPALGSWLFGCDVCQDVCPWNRKARTAREPALAPAAAIGDPAELLRLNDAAFRTRFRGTALMRAKRAGLARNAALFLGNRGDAAAVQDLDAALADPDPGVREAASWARRRLGVRDTAEEGSGDGGDSRCG